MGAILKPTGPRPEYGANLSILHSFDQKDLENAEDE
jgi:hypothetical protein